MHTCSGDADHVSVSLLSPQEQEFPIVVVSCVYIPLVTPISTLCFSGVPPCAKTNATAKYSGASILIFRYCTAVDWTIFGHHFKSMWTFLPEGFLILDLSSGNITKTFCTRLYIPLGLFLSFFKFTNHTALFKQKCKRPHPQSYSAQQWLEDAIPQLQDFLAGTNTEIFDREFNNRVTAIMDYINFYINTTLQI